METLDSICVRNGADKGSTHHVNGHDYARHYDFAFDSIRNNPIKIVEVGVGSAESIQSWLDYFPKAQVFGVDIVHDTNVWNTPGEKPAPRYTFVTGDQSSEDFWIAFVAKHGSDWDVFIEDGSHMIWHVIPCFKFMWPHVKSGGYYCVEDTGVCYGAGSVFLNAEFPTHAQWISSMVDEMHQGRGDIDSFYLARELVIMRKR